MKISSSFRSGCFLSLWFLTELSQDIRREAALMLQYNQSGPCVSDTETKPAPRAYKHESLHNMKLFRRDEGKLEI